jgi:hypothetical protein
MFYTFHLQQLEVERLDNDVPHAFLSGFCQ